MFSDKSVLLLAKMAFIHYVYFMFILGQYQTEKNSSFIYFRFSIPGFNPFNTSNSSDIRSHL